MSGPTLIEVNLIKADEIPDLPVVTEPCLALVALKIGFDIEDVPQGLYALPNSPLNLTVALPAAPNSTAILAQAITYNDQQLFEMIGVMQVAAGSAQTAQSLPGVLSTGVYGVFGTQDQLFRNSAIWPDGQPVVGALIKNEETGFGFLTDQDGTYSLFGIAGESDCSLEHAPTGCRTTVKIGEQPVLNCERTSISHVGILNANFEDGPPTARATAIIPYGASGYRYKIVGGGGDPGFEQPGFDDADFLLGSSPFGSLTGCPWNTPAGIRTTWPGNTDLLIRKQFSCPTGVTGIRVDVFIDNDVQVFINGVDVSGGMQVTENCDNHLSFGIPEDILEPEDNLLAVRARDRGWACYLDITVRAQDTVVTEEIPGWTGLGKVVESFGIATGTATPKYGKYMAEVPIPAPIENQILLQQTFTIPNEVRPHIKGLYCDARAVGAPVRLTLSIRDTTGASVLQDTEEFSDAQDWKPLGFRLSGFLETAVHPLALTVTATAHGPAVLLLDGFRFGKVWIAAHSAEETASCSPVESCFNADMRLTNQVYQQVGVTVDQRYLVSGITRWDLNGDLLVDDSDPVFCCCRTLEERALLSNQSVIATDVNMYYVRGVASSDQRLGYALCPVNPLPVVCPAAETPGNTQRVFVMRAITAGDPQKLVFGHELGHVLGLHHPGVYIWPLGYIPEEPENLMYRLSRGGRQLKTSQAAVILASEFVAIE